VQRSSHGEASDSKRARDQHALLWKRRGIFLFVPFLRYLAALGGK